MNAENPRFVLTPEFRLSYPKLKEPEKQEDGTPVWKIAMIFDTNIDAIVQAAETAAREKWAEKIPSGLKNPIKDGRPDVEAETGKVVVNASTYAACPALYDAAAKEINVEKADIFYPGCYCFAYIEAVTYDYPMSKGVRFNLHGVMFARDGERLGNSVDKKAMSNLFSPLATQQSKNPFNSPFPKGSIFGNSHQ